MFDLWLVGCFLTASVVHFLAMRNTFSHQLDFERVIKGAPWMFNKHLLVVHRLVENEDPMQRFSESDLGWDMTIKTPIRREYVENSVWLQGPNEEFARHVSRFKDGEEGFSNGWGQDTMVEDLEENPIKRLNGEKRQRKNSPTTSVSVLTDSLGVTDKQTQVYQEELSTVDSISQAKRRVQHMLKLYHPQIIFFLETKGGFGWTVGCGTVNAPPIQTHLKLDANRIKRAQRRWGFSNGIDVLEEGTKGGLSLGWRSEISVNLRSFLMNHIDVKIDREDGRMTGFYGHPNSRLRPESWELLKMLGQDHRRKDVWRFFEIHLSDCQLDDVGYEGPWFTWEK
ncbi:hypothetical protein Goklo_004992, partial [Gossypium klotzschianum]|nr:hypothetical protein [Gossypium klotzschianum]